MAREWYPQLVLWQEPEALPHQLAEPRERLEVLQVLVVQLGLQPEVPQLELWQELEPAVVPLELPQVLPQVLSQVPSVLHQAQEVQPHWPHHACDVFLRVPV